MGAKPLGGERLVLFIYFHMELPPKEDVDIDTYDDHRMAMASSLAACGDVDIIINDPGCTRKTFPTYFDVLKDVCK